MKTTDQTNTKRYPNFFTGISLLVLLIIVMSFITLKKNEYNSNNVEPTSILIVDGIYKIDTNIAVTNWKKEKLIAIIETENLTDKKTVVEIPNFIKLFLDGTTSNNTFDIANPDEEWQEGGWVNGFDKEKKNIAQAISSIAKPFPSKQLIYCGIGKNTALISYYIGGIKKIQNNIIIKFEGEKIVDLWFDHYYSQFGYSLGGTTDFVTSKVNIINYIKNTNSRGC